MRKSTIYLLMALAAALGLYLFSRTQRGGQLVSQAAQAVGQAGGWLMSQARGIRNNNPGNIVRTADQWVGESAQQTDPRFVVFDAPEYGIRAIVRILRNYFDRGARTVRQMIELWAPASENDTEAYISAVSLATGLDADQVLDFDTAAPLIVPAIIQHENGTQPYPPELIAQGVTLESTA